jgi:hypothetical protein
MYYIYVYLSSKEEISFNSDSFNNHQQSQSLMCPWQRAVIDNFRIVVMEILVRGCVSVITSG